MFDVCQISLTTKCNGICRYCHRNTNDVEPQDLDIAVADKLITKKAFFSGISGDPIFYSRLIPFIEKMQKNNPDLWVTIATNGSIRELHWWEELANVLSENKNSRVYFALDGLEDTHHIYRGTDYQTVLRRLKRFRISGGNVIWQTIYFKFNEHQIEDIRKTAEDLGCTFILKNSRTYEKQGAFAKPDDVIHESREEMCNDSDAVPHCFCFDKNEIWINPDGSVHPCCWLASWGVDEHLDVISWRENKRIDFDAFMLKLKSKNLINLNRNTMEEILNTQYFKHIEQNYKKMELCNRTCKVYWSDLVRNLPEDWK